MSCEEATNPNPDPVDPTSDPDDTDRDLYIHVFIAVNTKQHWLSTVNYRYKHGTSALHKSFTCLLT